ncbi:MAG: transposase, partial [Deltaproteobacteria bacterium]|nr:transposase [Deltaproteobacteria bacterium]
MNSIHDIFVEFGPEYLARFGEAIPQNHRKVMDAILNCRTPACGMVFYECSECGEIHQVFRSCGNRHCPNCQHQKTMD